VWQNTRQFEAITDSYVHAQYDSSVGIVLDLKQDKIDRGSCIDTTPVDHIRTHTGGSKAAARLARQGHFERIVHESMVILRQTRYFVLPQQTVSLRYEANQQRSVLHQLSSALSGTRVDRYRRYYIDQLLP
jgi:hypothetical protein